MRKIAMVMMAGLFLAGAATMVRAHEEMKMPDPAKRAEHIAKKLGLNDQQKGDVQKLIETKQQKMKDAHEEFEAGLKKTLTDEQFKKFESMEDEHAEHMKSHMKEEKEKMPK